ncbi:MAG: Dak phosphatase [Rothia sp. (in: high G+C Gram-positive bacteria)]|uniref:Dak phosphatase n=1 Tax=Rothia sp. (in: high G+C Gram-positive bacteria) TaxID=1885016 RepID=UPI0026DF0EF8|nr:Dak phosphatase [Rothia sp. (in: high G+C Gram-positive bacteria)]MDO5750956.1 Dak phosphatase [Rothia sp. (in: high G+C Gram-positive bacteria)]
MTDQHELKPRSSGPEALSFPGDTLRETLAHLAFGRAWTRTSVRSLERYAPALNELNGFPVPDKDTGSNLLATLQALASRYASSAAQAHTAWEDALIQTLARARGNSGMLTALWALEVGRSYYGFAGSLEEELGADAVDSLPLISALCEKAAELGQDYASVPAYELTRALALGAERIARTISDPALMPSTLGALMLVLADYRFHYLPQDTIRARTERAVYRKDALRAALMGTAQNPPAAHLAGTVDAGALGFYLGVIATNPLWVDARLDEGEVERMLEPRAYAEGISAGAAAISSESETEAGAVHTEWEFMATLLIEDASRVVELREDIQPLGDSLLLTPVDLGRGAWALHIHVADCDALKKVLGEYGAWENERISSLSAGEHGECSE